MESALEEEYMNLEVEDGWISFGYVIRDTYPDSYFCSCFDPNYLDSDEESPMIPGDGQSIILKSILCMILSLLPTALNTMRAPDSFTQVWHG